LSKKKSGLLGIINEMLSQSTVLEVHGKRFIVKNYNSEQGIIKWFLIKAAGFTTKVYPYTMNPRERMVREISFFEYINKIINTPRIYIKDWIGKIVVREYIEGETFDPASSLDEYYEIGGILARIHLENYVLGDSKYYNFLKSNNKYYIVDGEQAIKSNDQSYMYWDLFVFSTTVIYGLIDRYWNKALEHVNNVLKSFFNGYIDVDQKHGYRVLQQYSRFNYRALAYMLLPIPYNMQYIKIIESLI